MLSPLSPNFSPDVTAHSILDAVTRSAYLPCTKGESEQLIEWLELNILDAKKYHYAEKYDALAIKVYSAFIDLLKARQINLRP